jgi:predicted metal-binding membrane protein
MPVPSGDHPKPAAPREPTVLERLLRRDRWFAAGGLAVVTMLCWIWIVPMARDMYGSMSGPSEWMMTPTWDLKHLLLLWAMWTVMMTGMMLPSAAPLLLLYAGALRRQSPGPGLLQVYAMAAGYLVVWLLFSLAATMLQRILSRLLLLTPMMEAAGPAAAGGLLLFAGIYQLTPLKGRCLQACRSPLSFVSTRWRPGTTGAVRMGIEHGIYCLGCCWALMLLLFAGGVMNLYVIAALTVFVLIEKVAPFGVQSSRICAAALIGVGTWLVIPR